MPDLSLDLSLSPPAQTVRAVEEMQAIEAQPEIRAVVEVLENDPITTAHILRQVNSPIYSLRQSVATVDRAATMLGFDAVANTVFVETFSSKPEELSTGIGKLAYAYLVQTSVAASRIADELARGLGMERHGIVRTAALIHQLGRMGLLSEDPARYLDLWEESTSPKGQPVAIPPGIGREIAHFRTDYMRYGKSIAAKWGLPDVVAEAIRHHTDPDRTDESDRPVVAAVGVAQYAARSMFEPEDELDRDQGAKRAEAAAVWLAKGSGNPVSRLHKMLEAAKSAAFEKATAIEL